MSWEDYLEALPGKVIKRIRIIISVSLAPDRFVDQGWMCEAGVKKVLWAPVVLQTSDSEYPETSLYIQFQWFARTILQPAFTS